MEQKDPLYKKLAPKIRKLKALGMTNIEIATKFKISRKTIKKALS
jgi:DNA-binding CsgD family transcriptional regulator